MSDLDYINRALAALPGSEDAFYDLNTPEVETKEEHALIQYFEFFKEIIVANNQQAKLPTPFNLSLQINAAIYLEAIGNSDASLKLVRRLLKNRIDQILELGEIEPVLVRKFFCLCLIFYQKNKEPALLEHAIKFEDETNLSNLEIMESLKQGRLIEHLNFDDTIKARSFKSIDDFEFQEPLSQTKFDTPEIFSICISIHKLGPNISHALNSIRNQTFKAFRAYLALDTNDETVVAFAREFASRDSRFEVVEKNNSLGTYNSRNIVLERSNGAYFMAHDSDDILRKDYLEAVVQRTARQPILGVLSLSIRIDPNNRMLAPSHVGAIERTGYPTLCFKKNEVLSRIGYYKEWRHSADSEYQARIRRVFGKTSLGRMEFVGLLQRDDFDNLTRQVSLGLMGHLVSPERRKKAATI